MRNIKSKMLSWGTIKEEPGVYVIFNLITSDFYIGSTINVKRRFYKHSHSSHNEHIRNEMEKYGKEFFLFEVIKYGEAWEVWLREREIIRRFKPAYNMGGKFFKNKEIEKINEQIKALKTIKINR